ncbi:MAG: hypothetical protein H7240_09260 [Glaciimonas sp.]|nr:hypothetical protein [Glaciimonas sp.]
MAILNIQFLRLINSNIKMLFGELRIEQSGINVRDALYMPQHGRGGLMLQKIASTKKDRFHQV